MQQSEQTFVLEESIQIQSTPDCGRGVFAKRDIPAGTILLDTSFTSFTVLLREYRKEVCAQCFGYNLGTHLAYRDALVNFSFCSPACQDEWKASTSPLAYAAWQAVEAHIQAKAGRGRKHVIHGLPDATDEQGDTTMSDYPRRPTKQEIDHAWRAVDETACLIRQHRHGCASRPSRKAVNTALSTALHPEILYFLLSGILAQHPSVTSSDQASVTASPRPWRSLLQLAATDTPYPSTFFLTNHLTSYLVLLTLVPLSLIQSVTEQVARAVVAHDAHNAFGIRSLDDRGSEFFGWGVWPDASFFNHSCACNVYKVRQARRWRFLAADKIRSGEQLTITYLGGDEQDLTAYERGRRTDSIWGFVCACTACLSGTVDQVC